MARGKRRPGRRRRCVAPFVDVRLSCGCEIARKTKLRILGWDHAAGLVVRCPKDGRAFAPITKVRSA